MKPNIRRCVSCRAVAHKQNLWRVVRVYPSQKVQLDYGNGRSAYLCPESSCLIDAQRKNRLGRALKTKIPPEIYHTLSNRLKDKQMPTPNKSRNH